MRFTSVGSSVFSASTGSERATACSSPFTVFTLSLCIWDDTNSFIRASTCCWIVWLVCDSTRKLQMNRRFPFTLSSACPVFRARPFLPPSKLVSRMYCSDFSNRSRAKPGMAEDAISVAERLSLVQVSKKFASRDSFPGNDFPLDIRISPGKPSVRAASFVGFLLSELDGFIGRSPMSRHGMQEKRFTIRAATASVLAESVGSIPRRMVSRICGTKLGKYRSMEGISRAYKRKVLAIRVDWFGSFNTSSPEWKKECRLFSRSQVLNKGKPLPYFANRSSTLVPS
mmetsp:Transcript_26018/g.65568  ORF Transcript_26018/g.65568 Transcript_26018/m.65568 type:complete len:284 (+) Transcript_26018:6580-7431(+)